MTHVTSKTLNKIVQIHNSSREYLLCIFGIRKIIIAHEWFLA